MDRQREVENGKATVALSLGILSVTCLGAVAGIPAFLLGAAAHRTAEKPGALGRVAAITAMILGAAGTALTIVAVACGVMAWSYQRNLAMTEEPVTSPEVSYKRTDDLPPRIGLTTRGNIEIIELGRTDRRSLRSQLEDARERGKSSKKSVLVYMATKTCRPCLEFEAQLADPRMQVALSKTVLVKVDAGEFDGELDPFRLDVDSVPWFFQLDSHTRAKDGISAAEWDHNVAGDMAPVFESFLAGKYKKRRLPPPLGITL